MPPPAHRGLMSRAREAFLTLLGRGAPAGYSTGSAWSGGPMYSDAWGSKRGPSPWQLVEYYKSLSFFLTNLNSNRVAATPLRLYAVSSKAKGWERPRSACGPVTVGRTQARWLRSRPYLTRSLAGSDDLAEVTNHPLLDLLDRPDPLHYFSRRSLIDLLCRYVDVVGVAYLKHVGGALPEELWPLQAQYVWPVRTSDSALIDHYDYFAERYEFDELVRFRLRPSLRDPYGAGYSATQAAWEYLGLEDKFVSVQEQLLGNGPRPGIFVSAKDPAQAPGEAERKRFEQDLNRQHSRGMQGRALVTTGTWDVTPLTYPPSDLAGLNISEYDLERAANCFDVPVALLSKETNLANMQASLEAHALNAVEPRCDMIASELTALARKIDPRLFFAFDNPGKEDAEREARIVDINLKNGRVTINQANENNGYPPQPWGNEPWLPGTLKQPSQMEEDRQTAKAALLAKPTPDGDADTQADEEEAGEGENRRHFRRAREGVPTAASILGKALRKRGLAHKYVSGELTPKERFDVLHDIRLAAREWLRAEAEAVLKEITPKVERAFIGDAAEKLGAFFGKTKRYLREVFTAAALTVLGPDPLNAAELHAIDKGLTAQVEYLNRFQREVESGTQELNGTFVSRAESYGASAWSAGNNVLRDSAMSSDIFTQERRVHIGADLPCDTCIEQEGKGWVPIGTLKAIGDSPCMSACHCHFEWREGEDSEPYVAGRGPLHEPAFGTRSLAIPGIYDKREGSEANAFRAGNVLKHNPNHDAHSGRFTTGHGGSAVARRALQDNTEKEVASAVGGKRLNGYEPYDVLAAGKGGHGEHAIEVKSFHYGKEKDISVHDGAMIRKIDDAHASGRTYHTVVVDMRHSAEGGAHAGAYSGHDIYYKRAAGRYSLASMHKVSSVEELNHLIHADAKSLPKAAQGEFPKGGALKELRERAAKEKAYNDQRSKERKARLKEQGVSAYGRPVASP